MRAYRQCSRTNGERPAHYLISNMPVDYGMFFRPSLTSGSPLGSSFLGRRLRSKCNLVRISTLFFDGLAEAMNEKQQTRLFVATLGANASAHEPVEPCLALAIGLARV